MVALTCESKSEVDLKINSGATTGGKSDPNSIKDLGFMYQRSLEDPDGHTLEFFWMDASSVQLTDSK